ncbi:NADP-dependent oxidoreductase [Salinibacterium sp. G-O1]|uniref:NADP-dependent oxidoreductase n=1 Tax=Salinibacterium sp. G-O1 TaxID=3046208 RepID=UPI0024BBE4BA|nr:NADP-dependent oxidoreductase [Salinibacterium sp. G-O1]MDJ0334298.1 NADP-dependent oxidoreductase [Salinibacterium sp. G-O1]
MRAIVIDATGSPDVLHLSEIARPITVNAEFLVKVVAASVNPIDAKSRAGAGVAAAFGAFPVVLGNDFSGHVVESPYTSHPIKVGDEVYGMTMVPRFGGTYAEYVAVPATCIAKKPTSLSHVEAAAVPLAALTAWGAVVDVAKAHEGQRILIHAGSGGVGHFAIQFANYFGARVITTGSTRNTGWLRDLGASQVIDHTLSRFEDVTSDLDVVIDLVGNLTEETATRSLGVLKPGGLIVSVPSGAWPTMAEDAAAAGVRATGYKVPADGATLSVISRLLESGDIRVFVDQVFDLDQAAEAHTALETGHTRGKIVLTVSPG